MMVDAMLGHSQGFMHVRQALYKNERHSQTVVISNYIIILCCAGVRGTDRREKEEEEKMRKGKERLEIFLASCTSA